MVTYYVRGPFTNSGAVLTSRDCYCDAGCTEPGCLSDPDCLHQLNGGVPGFTWTKPRDVSASSGWNINFWPSNNVLSCQVTRRPDIGGSCCGGCGTPWENGVPVDFFRCEDAAGYIGTILYYHVRSMRANGVYNMAETGNPGRLVVGTVPISLPSPGEGCTPSCCYTGHHSHMQIANITGVTAAASISCGASVIGGQTNLYTWTYSSPSSCV